MIEYQGIKSAVMGQAEQIYVALVNILHVPVNVMPANGYPPATHDLARLTVQRIRPLSALVKSPFVTLNLHFELPIQ